MLLNSYLFLTSVFWNGNISDKIFIKATSQDTLKSVTIGELKNAYERKRQAELEKNKRDSLEIAARKKDSLKRKRLGQDTLKKAVTMEDLRARYQKGKAQSEKDLANMDKQFLKYRNPALAYGSYEFDQYKTNIDRFAKSPCFNKIGFNPREDLVKLEKEYEECEKKYYLEKIYLILKYVGGAVLLFGVVYFVVKLYKSV